MFVLIEADLIALPSQVQVGAIVGAVRACCEGMFIVHCHTHSLIKDNEHVGWLQEAEWPVLLTLD